MSLPEASIAEIARDTWRIHVAVPPAWVPGGFSFNQYLVIDERPLLFHTGPKKLFRVVREQVEKVLPLSELRRIAFSHVESDECGSLADFIAAAPNAQVVCSDTAALVSVRDLIDLEPIGLADGETLDLGRHRLVWQSTPHLPHGWDCGMLFDETTRTLFCADLFTQGGSGDAPLWPGDLLEASEAFRRRCDDFAHSRDTPALLDKLAQLRPETIACMHGSAWAGDGARLLRRLASALAGT
ncbi:MAG TPA: FprA family A-type flavoprotein [Rubrivivax sp.]